MRRLNVMECFQLTEDSILEAMFAENYCLQVLVAAVAAVD